MSGLQVILTLGTGPGHLPRKQTLRIRTLTPRLPPQLQTDTVQCSFGFRMTHTTQMRLLEAKAPSMSLLRRLLEQLCLRLPGGVPPSPGIVEMVHRAPFSSAGPDPFRDHHPREGDSREHNAVVDLPAPVPPAQVTAAMTIYVTRQGDIHLPGFIRYFPPERHLRYKAPARKSPANIM